MSKSIMHNKESGRCYVCNKHKRLWEHHVFGGSNKKNSEKYGLKVYLCIDCHTVSPTGVHHNKELMQELHEKGQETFELKCGTREDFMRIFGRNYL